MRIIKLASGPVPPGFKRIKVIVRPDGTAESAIERGGQSKCSSNGAKILSGIMNTLPEGYSGTFGVKAEMHTTHEYDEQVARNKQPVAPVKTPKQEEYTPLNQEEEDRRRAEGTVGV